MGASFIRRFTSDPGASVLLEIESVNILDLEPPASITGVGTGTVIHVGEFENGPFNTPTQVSSADDVVSTFGSLGYTDVISGVAANNPCARVRSADGTAVPEAWNGNSHVQLNGKKFAGLILVRADTSVGTVEFRKQAYITGAAAFRYDLEPAQILALNIGAGPVSATFSAAAAVVTGAGATFAIVGGETLTIGVDQQADVVVTFLAGDNSVANMVSRINTFVPGVASNSGGQVAITSRVRGLGAQVRIVAGSGGMAAITGFTIPTTTNGTGNVQNIDAVTPAEVATIVEAAVAGTKVTTDSAGRLRVSKTFVAAGDYIVVTSNTTATALGFTVGTEGANDGKARMLSAVIGAGSAGTITMGVDSAPNFTVTFAGAENQAAAIALFNTAAGYTIASAPDGTHILFTGATNGGQVRIISGTAATVAAMGLVVATSVTTPALVAGTLPAGTVVQNSAATRIFVTMQDVAILAPTTTPAATNVGPYTVKIRHATDDGTGLSSAAGTVAIVAQAPTLGSFSVVNPSGATACLTEGQIDAAYTTAIASTLDLNSVAKTGNLIYAARQSNTVRRQLRQNALDASSIGMLGRMAIIRTPLGTLKADAKSTVAEPGVGAYRDQRVIYCYPQARTFVPLVARRGLAGGTSFSADGNLDVGADGFLASVLSQLPPEENPGQETAYTSGVIGIESSVNAMNFTISDYTAFKAAGICALRIDDGVAIYQSGVTSVDPAVNSSLVRISRRRMADYIEDTLALRAKAFGKKLSTDNRRRAITSEIRAFMSDLLGKNNPGTQRIAGYTVDDKSFNTPTILAAGRFRVRVSVRTLASLDSIELEVTAGESVQVDEVLAA